MAMTTLLDSRLEDPINIYALHQIALVSILRLSDLVEYTNRIYVRYVKYIMYTSIYYYPARHYDTEHLKCNSCHKTIEYMHVYAFRYYIDNCHLNCLVRYRY